ncbi:unnamed protein product [Acanthosepion pharaonis]|uniref:Uncharacterized protein n=1 Tax=Acanthosepion pharaonis TaxID=158019 RepID=A0A812AS63_ACAPH|nr:unnamed protein product [Sepia pharaonis]
MIGLGVSTRSCPNTLLVEFQVRSNRGHFRLPRPCHIAAFVYLLFTFINSFTSVCLSLFLVTPPPPPPPRFNRISCKQESNCKNHDFSSFLPFSFLSFIIFSSFAFFLTFLSRHLCYFLYLFAFLLCIFLHISSSTIISFSFLPPLLRLFFFTVTFHLFVTSYSFTLIATFSSHSPVTYFSPSSLHSFIIFFFKVTPYYFFFVHLPLLTHFFFPLSFHLFLPLSSCHLIPIFLSHLMNFFKTPTISTTR